MLEGLLLSCVWSRDDRILCSFNFQVKSYLMKMLSTMTTMPTCDIKIWLYSRTISQRHHKTISHKKCWFFKVSFKCCDDNRISLLLYRHLPAPEQKQEKVHIDSPKYCDRHHKDWCSLSKDTVAIVFHYGFIEHRLQMRWQMMYY